MNRRPLTHPVSLSWTDRAHHQEYEKSVKDREASNLKVVACLWLLAVAS